MHTLKKITLSTLPIILGISFSAQAGEPEMKAETKTVAESFASADLDQNGSLDRDEFVSFAVMRADQGDEEMKGTVMANEYDIAFTASDADADGGVTLEELGGDDSGADTDIDVDTDTDLEIEPEM